MKNETPFGITGRIIAAVLFPKGVFCSIIQGVFYSIIQFNSYLFLFLQIVFLFEKPHPICFS